MATNNFPVGLPVAPKNEEKWPEKQPFLARQVRGAVLTSLKASAVMSLQSSDTRLAHRHIGQKDASLYIKSWTTVMTSYNVSNRWS